MPLIVRGIVLNLIQIRRALVPSVAALALVGSLAACGSDNSGSGDATTGAASGLSGKVAAGGSSAQETAQKAWRAGFGASNPDVTISYDAVGSGDGRSGFTGGKYDFVGSDSAMDADELKAADSRCGADPIEFPVFISPIDVVFNLPGIKTLNLDATTVASIFAGKITTWDDKTIADQNPGVSLPSTAIAPVHRSDSSGTTDNFTDYLHQAAPSVWTSDHSSDWPTTSGEKAEGTSGVIGAVSDGKGTIAYADDSGVQGTGLGVVSIKVGDSYVAPSAEGAANGLAASSTVSGTPDSVLQYQIDRTTTDDSVYPVFMASYEIACQKYDDDATTQIVKAFLTYLISENGQKAAAANAYSAPLPSDIAAAEQKIVDRMGQ